MPPVPEPETGLDLKQEATARSACCGGVQGLWEGREPAMSEEDLTVVEEVDVRVVIDIEAIPDGSGNDRDPDEIDAERFDAG